MNEPRRWRDSGDAPEDLQRMFAAGRPAREMPAGARRRIARNLLGPVAGFVALATWKSIAVAAVLGVATTAGIVATVHVVTTETAAPQAPPPLPAVTAQRLGKQAAPPVPLAARAEATEPSTVTPATAASSASTTAMSAPPDPVRVPRLTAPVSTTETAHAPAAVGPSGTTSTPGTTASPAASGDTLARELALLDLARERYEAHPEDTLAVLNEHARQFPSGKLALERELLALDALKKLGRVDEERTRADKLLSSVRGTLFESRVRAHAAPETP